MNDFAAAVLAWYDRHGRKNLPWQNPASPYRVWVSEIMLQQTQVRTVLDYFERFMQRFPNLASLAAAEQDEVLNYWSGLGYYTRGRNLHRAAQQLQDSYNGQFPQDLQTMQSLPGIGRSTAAAILSLAFGQPEAILDGNVKRVLARVHGIDAWPGHNTVLKQLWTLAESHLSTARPGPYNQAMMDIGASVCSARRPNCSSCPLSERCLAHQSGHPEQFPGKKTRKTIPTRSTCMLLLRNADGAILLQKRPPQGIWAGLWSFPEFSDPISAANWVHSSYPQSKASAPTSGDSFRHTFSHFHLDIQPLHVHCQTNPHHVFEDNQQVWYKTGPLPGGIPKPVAHLLNTATQQVKSPT